MMRYLKRSFALLLALILVGSVLPVQAFATETCAHNYESVVTDPTCTEKGYTTHTCTLCGDSYADTYVNELRHSPEQEEGLKAGCLTDGFTSYSVCTRCGDWDGTIVPGEVTGDGKIDMADAYRIILYLSGKLTLNEAEQAAADVNGDGMVDFIDIYQIILYYREVTK